MIIIFLVSISYCCFINSRDNSKLAAPLVAILEEAGQEVPEDLVDVVRYAVPASSGFNS